MFLSIYKILSNYLLRRLPQHSLYIGSKTESTQVANNKRFIDHSFIPYNAHTLFVQFNYMPFCVSSIYFWRSRFVSATATFSYLPCKDLTIQILVCILFLFFFSFFLCFSTYAWNSHWYVYMQIYRYTIRIAITIIGSDSSKSKNSMKIIIIVSHYLLIRRAARFFVVNPC